MAKKLTPIAGKEIRFNFNEPVKEIKGGLERKSTLVSREKYTLISAREHLNTILLNHCSNEDITKMLLPEYETILHKICLESISGGCNPVVRKKAIWALRHYATERSTNLLTDLAIHGEDEYLRGHALSSLAAFKTAPSIPLLTDALFDKSDIVSNSARIGLEGYKGNAEGIKMLNSAWKREKNVRIKRELQNIIVGTRQNPGRLSTGPKPATKEN
jgi:hypothetical protein